MTGRSTMLDNLVDDLVPDVVDELRADLYDSMGIRQHEVHLVRRAWSGPGRNEGTVVRVDDVVISPPPLFQDKTQYKLTAAGRTEEGDGRLSEVSLTYTEAELLGYPIAPNEEFFYKVLDMRGQGIAPAYYVPNGRVVSDRERTLGWVISLNRVEIEP